MDKAMRIVDGLLTVLSAIVRAAARGDTESVDKILGDDLEISLARAAAEARAVEKFREV